MKRILIIIMSIAHVFLLSVPAGAEKLTLRECLIAASRNNPSLKVMAYSEKIAEDEIGIASGTYLPRLDAQAAYTVQNEAQSIKVGPMELDMQEPRYASGNVAATQTLYDFGRTESRTKKAEAMKTVAGCNYRAREQDVFMKIVEAYYGILEAEKFVRAADQEIMQMEQHLKVAKVLFEQGAATRNDVLQADVQLANSRQRRLSAGNRLENRWLALHYLTGMEPSRRGELEEDGKTESYTYTGSIPDFSGHSEIQAMNGIIEADRRALNEAASYYRPEIFGRVQGDYLQNREVEEQSIYSATVGMKVNLFDGYATTSRCGQARKNLLMHEEALRELGKRLMLEYQTAVNDSEVAGKRIETISKAIALGEENLRINVNRYQEHAGTATGVLDAQTLLTQTRTEYYRAVFDRQVAVARIRKAVGNL